MACTGNDEYILGFHKLVTIGVVIQSYLNLINTYAQFSYLDYNTKYKQI